jgi:hypothetical protein
MILRHKTQMMTLFECSMMLMPKVGDGSTSGAEGDGCKCVVSFKDRMKEVELEHLCFDSNEIEIGVEVGNNDAFMCEVTDNNVQLGLY